MTATNLVPIHDPTFFTRNLRQIVGQGKKRIGLLVGAGAPTSIRINDDSGGLTHRRPLIPDVDGLTRTVVNALPASQRKTVEALRRDLQDEPNIEELLTRVRKLSQVIGTSVVHDFDGKQYTDLGKSICNRIGEVVGARLPNGNNPYSEIVAWIAGTRRKHSIEIFTPNYDLLLEEAFERSRTPYFDGFTGSYRPFFDPASVDASDDLPMRWSRLWKLHGSLGWKIVGETVIRTGSRSDTEVIYPDHLKYDQISRLPYSALFERLRAFLHTPDTLLLCSGFSFMDRHIKAVLDEALALNPHTAVFALQYKTLEDSHPAVELAIARPNMSVYARDGAVVGGVAGQWAPDTVLTDESDSTRGTYWNRDSDAGPFLLGDFALLARFLALNSAQLVPFGEEEPSTESEPSSKD